VHPSDASGGENKWTKRAKHDGSPESLYFLTREAQMGRLEREAFELQSLRAQIASARALR
jgi:hypothetical protein